MKKIVGEGQKFERIRRITGYLVGGLDRFNNGKRAEEADRVKHSGIRGKNCYLDTRMSSCMPWMSKSGDS